MLSASIRYPLICTMFAVSPLLPAAIVFSLTTPQNAPQPVETRQADRPAQHQRLKLGSMLRWQHAAEVVPCPVYGADALCTRHTLTSHTGEPIRGMMGRAQVRFAADARAHATGVMVEQHPGVYLSPAAPDRRGLWEVRLIIGHHEAVSPSVELVERFDFAPTHPRTAIMTDHPVLAP